MSAVRGTVGGVGYLNGPSTVTVKMKLVFLAWIFMIDRGSATLPTCKYFPFVWSVKVLYRRTLVVRTLMACTHGCFEFVLDSLVKSTLLQV